MNVVITAGGTIEPIDNVRSISNSSTGKLGCLIAQAYSRLDIVDRIYFICGTKSVLPDSEKLAVIHVDTALSLERELRKVIAEANIDIIIHSMAVSDYRIGDVTTLSRLTAALNKALQSKDGLNTTLSEDMLRTILCSPEVSLNRDGKLSSDMDDLLLTMKKNPKIISMFQSIAPAATLVGFKLLDHADNKALLAAARHILIDNKCSLVLANDLRDITCDQHTGYLISEDNTCGTFHTKEDIASAIVAATLKKRGVTL